MELIVAFCIGILIGCVFTVIIFRVMAVGTLRIDTSDPNDDPYLFLELSKDVNAIRQKKYITLKVNIKNFITHK